MPQLGLPFGRIVSCHLHRAVGGRLRQLSLTAGRWLSYLRLDTGYLVLVVQHEYR